MQIFLILCLLLVVCNTYKVQESVHSWNVSYIVGGNPVDAGEVPWTAALFVGDTFCGGSIITKRTILTAAHCIKGLVAPEIKVRVGSLRYSTGGTLLTVSKVIPHPSYSSYDYDIGVLILSSDIPIDGKNVDIVDLAKANTEPPVGSIAKVVGWGVQKENGSLSDVLMKVEVPFVSRSSCNSTYSTLPKPIPISERMICAGYEAGGKDACQGDSGGPLTQNNTQVGVVSFGNGCALSKYPNIYSSVGAYRSWIDLNKV